VRIGLIHTRLLHKGGLERRLWSYMEYLQKAGHEVTVMVFQVGEGMQVPDGVRLLKANISWVPKPLRAWVFDNWLGKVVASEGFDRVVSLGRTSHQDVLMLPGNHLGYLRAMGKRGRSIDDRLQIMMDRRAYASPGVILACSEMMRDEVVELYGVNPQKIKVLYPPTDTTRFHAGLRENRAELRNRFGMQPDKLSLVLVSASHGRKGLPLLLEVFESLQNEPFELLVAGEEPIHSRLPTVRALGFVKDTEALFAAADFTVLPALYEPYGQVISESILCGTPVLISAMVGAKSAILESEGIVVPQLTPEVWLKAIRSLPQRQFQVPGDFAQRNRIGLKEHMAFILADKPGTEEISP
jgi:glycosyltransferase involved in cell wall biosynthesis